jgi:hypothetical protein
MNHRETAVLNTLMVSPNSRNADTVHDFINEAFAGVDENRVWDSTELVELAETFLVTGISATVGEAFDEAAEMVSLVQTDN